MPNPLLPKDRIIVALDVKSFEELRPLVLDLKDHVGLFKIGWTLLISEGLNVIRKIRDLSEGAGRLFLDFKLTSRTITHLVEDIPQQQRGAAEVLLNESRGVGFVTVHTYEGERKVGDLVQSFRTEGTKILGVTLLTSTDASDSEENSSKPEEIVLKRATIAKNAGCDGAVCSGREAKLVKEWYGANFLVVTPGIRPSWSQIEHDDQKRVTTARDAIRNGADYIVVGRPIYSEKDYVGAAKRIAEEIECALDRPPPNLG